MTKRGYLQHSAPFRTEAVDVQRVSRNQYEAFFEGRWRKIHFGKICNHIKYQGQNIIILLPKED